MAEKISKSEARSLALYGQFSVEGVAHGGDITERTAHMIAHLGYVQIDTISVVERAHHHVLWSRLHDYQRGVITRLQQPPRRIFEYWSHAAAYLPLDHYRYCLPRMTRLRQNGFQWYPRVEKDVQTALEIVTKEGPKQAKDFKANDGIKRGQWWDLKPMKVAMEHLFQEGRLMVSVRNGFQKVYDLPQRVLPVGVDTTMPTDEETAHFLIANTLRSLGTAAEKDFSYQRKDGVGAIGRVLKEKIEAGDIVELEIEAVNRPYYVTRQLIEAVAGQANHEPSIVRILSPFDNQVIIRRRLAEVFDFDYQIECYVPEAKRKFGYFSLPILYNREFVGLLDGKADRKSKTFIINHLHISRMPEDKSEFLHHLSLEIHAFKTFNKCSNLETDRVFPAGIKRTIKSIIKKHT